MKYFYFLLILGFVSCQNQPKIHNIQGFAQGSTYSITYISNQPIEGIQKQVDSIFEQIDASMSTYKENSLISKINQGQNVPVDFHFKNVLLMSQKIYAQSQGYFDPTIGTLIDAWGFGKNEHHQKPSPTKVDSLLLQVGMDKIFLSEDDFIQKKSKNIQLNFNAIAQGYTCDVIADFFKTKDIHHFIVEVGGEMVISGKNITQQKPWKIGIDNPLQQPDTPREIIETIEVENVGIATSGNYRKVWQDAQGNKFVHTINPQTGYPEATDILSATVLAPTAMQADAYATTIMAMGKQKAEIFLQQYPELKVLLLYSDNQQNVAKKWINTP